MENVMVAVYPVAGIYTTGNYIHGGNYLIR
jgi:hypothetical protein